ncbi:hypothetical protein NCCP2716_17440 [Sporosarcina sp. NCCP-2716]|uniref:hypothetical protein n=1 Tax=Sporosarcina sp. NCCP-2716 TaxID=2943679 RepID=UPI00203FFDC7|nr:hypothetical protein [Sporosarcina sp. NCCP-2716]GKV69246.1 hypothetical protein NCCP2716_17440 [Sporosarcina sp. NCCP-2716]
MKKSTIVLSLVLFASLLLNAYLAVDRSTYRSFSPNLEDQAILGEMTMMVLDSPQYKGITEKETVYAVKQGVDRYNSGNPASIHNYEITVVTDQQAYGFTCDDEACTSVSNGRWGGDLYTESHPILPLKGAGEE